MPQNSQIIGVNSVTNIELDKGVMPAPIIRNADWFEKFDRPVPLDAFSARRMAFDGQPVAHAIAAPCHYRIVAIGRFTRESRMRR